MSTVRQYELCDVQDEVKALVTRGVINRKNRIYSLCTFFSYQEWLGIEKILDENDFLLRDPILDLIGPEVWLND